MRLAEARITLGVVRAREGDLEGALDLPSVCPARLRACMMTKDPRACTP